MVVLMEVIKLLATVIRSKGMQKSWSLFISFILELWPQKFFRKITKSHEGKNDRRIDEENTTLVELIEYHKFSI